MDSFADTLWRRNQDTAEAALHHPFLRGIASGKLPRAAFAHYVGQDAAFLDAYCRAYALGSAKSPDREGVMVFKTLLDAAVEELALHRGYADRWGVDLDPPIGAATAAYTDFILAVAALEPVGHIAAAMAPCLRLYSYLGQQLNPHTQPGNPFREWVTTYSDPEFEKLAERLEGLVDRYGGDSKRMTFLYGRGMELEMQFFSSCAQGVS